MFLRIIILMSALSSAFINCSESRDIMALDISFGLKLLLNQIDQPIRLTFLVCWKKGKKLSKYPIEIKPKIFISSRIFSFIYAQFFF